MASNSTYVLDTAATWRSVVLMGSTPKEKFGSPGEIEVNAAGQKKYSIELAVSYPAPAPGMKGGSEVITVTIPGDRDPAEGMNVPCPVQLEGVKMGVSGVERRGDRLVGGKPYFSATGLRAVGAAPGLRPVGRPEGDQKAS